MTISGDANQSVNPDGSSTAAMIQEALALALVDEYNYHTETDRIMLYVATTRVRHRLSLTFYGKPALFLKKVFEKQVALPIQSS